MNDPIELEVCPVCQGDNDSPCHNCGGTGWYVDDGWYIFEDDGYGDALRVQCHQCYGTGSEPQCSYCGGAGFIEAVQDAK